MVRELPVVTSQQCSEPLGRKATRFFKRQDRLARPCASAHSHSAVGAQKVEHPNLILGENQPTRLLVGQGNSLARAARRVDDRWPDCIHL